MKPSVTLTVFDAKLKVLYNIYKTQQSDAVKVFDNLTDEEIICFLLTVEASLTYNKKNNTVGMNAAPSQC